MYYTRIQRCLGSDLEFQGSLGNCIAFIVSNINLNYRGHFILKVL